MTVDCKQFEGREGVEKRIHPWDKQTEGREGAEKRIHSWDIMETVTYIQTWQFIIIIIIVVSHRVQISLQRKLSALAHTIYSYMHTYIHKSIHKHMVSLDLWNGLSKKESLEPSFEFREGGENPQTDRQ